MVFARADIESIMLLISRALGWVCFTLPLAQYRGMALAGVVNWIRIMSWPISLAPDQFRCDLVNRTWQRTLTGLFCKDSDRIFAFEYTRKKDTERAICVHFEYSIYNDTDTFKTIGRKYGAKCEL